MTRKLINVLAICGTLSMIVIFLTFNVTSGQNVDKLAGGGRIEGTWNVHVSIINCATGGVIRSFDSIGSFNQGGTMIDSTSGIAQSLKTPGHGVWAHTTGNSYTFRFKSFSFDAAGNYTGYTIIQHEANLDATGNSYTSAGTAEIYSPSDTLVMTGCSSTTASRFSL